MSNYQCQYCLAIIIMGHALAQAYSDLIVLSQGGNPLVNWRIVCFESANKYQVTFSGSRC